MVWGWGWGGERCKLLLPGGEESQRGSRYRVVLEGLGMGLVWDEGSRELGIMTNSRFPDYLRVGNSGIHRTGLSHHRRGRCSIMFRRQDHRVGSGGFRRVGKGMECGAMRGGENAHHKRVRWAHTEGSKCYD